MTDHIYQEFVKVFTELNNFKHYKCGTEFEYILPNNGNKYYILVCSVQNFKGIHAIHHSILNTDFSSSEKIKTTTPTEFSIELDSTHPLLKYYNGYLFEGFLYDSDTLNPYDFYITDILFTKKDRCILSLPYEMRYLNIMNLFNDNFDMFNNIDLTLNMKPSNIFPKTNFTDLLIENHIHKSKLTHIEYILNHIYSKKNVALFNNQSKEQKILIKTDKTEVIEVHNKDTNNNEGILYIKNKTISHYLRDKLKQKDTILMTCIFNRKFNKWEPIIDQ